MHRILHGHGAGLCCPPLFWLISRRLDQRIGYLFKFVYDKAHSAVVQGLVAPGPEKRSHLNTRYNFSTLYNLRRCRQCRFDTEISEGWHASVNIAHSCQ